MRKRSAIGVIALLLGTLPGAASAAPTFKLRRVAALNGAGDAVFLASPKGDSRVFVVDQSGVVRVLKNGRLTTFVDVRSRVQAGGEQGLLSIAFHPNFATNHRFFLYYTARGGDVTIAEGRATGDRGNYRRTLVTIRHRQAGNHNGGQLQFGPDGRLWIGTGDGGGGNDEFGHAQDRRSLLGKMLRLNVDQAGAKPRIWGIGLRNPWRFSFDRITGTLWIGDVGQGKWEEIDRVSKPQTRSLRNFGWGRYEGREVFNGGRTLNGGTLVRPLTVVGHPESVAIVGGYVYRGTDVPALRGYYLYADNQSPWIRGLKRVGNRVLTFKKTAGVPSGITSFGEDGRGNVYVATYNGIYRLVR
jgi:glucose/arabinose dehydrogenase